MAFNQDFMFNPLLGIAQGLLQGGGWSEKPTTFGQALAGGLAQGQNLIQQKSVLDEQRGRVNAINQKLDEAKRAREQERQLASALQSAPGQEMVRTGNTQGLIQALTGMGASPDITMPLIGGQIDAQAQAQQQQAEDLRRQQEMAQEAALKRQGYDEQRAAQERLFEHQRLLASQQQGAQAGLERMKLAEQAKLAQTIQTEPPAFVREATALGIPIEQARQTWIDAKTKPLVALTESERKQQKLSGSGIEDIEQIKKLGGAGASSYAITPNIFASGKGEQARAAYERAIQKLIYLQSGAQASQQEIEAYSKSYMPQIGESPETSEQKLKALERDLIKYGAGTEEGKPSSSSSKWRPIAPGIEVED